MESDAPEDPSRIEEVVPDEGPDLPASAGTGHRYADIRSDLDPDYLAATRLALVLRGYWIGIPDFFDQPTSDLMRLRGQGATERVKLRVTLQAIKAISDSDRPIKAWLWSQAALSALDLVGHDEQNKFSEMALNFISNALEELAACAVLPMEPGVADIYTVASEVIARFGEGTVEQNRRAAIEYGKKALRLAEGSEGPDAEMHRHMLSHNLLQYLVADTTDPDELLFGIEELKTVLEGYRVHLGETNSLTLGTAGSLMQALRRLSDFGFTSSLEEAYEIGEKYRQAIDLEDLGGTDRYHFVFLASLSTVCRDRRHGDPAINLDKALLYGRSAVKIGRRKLGPFSIELAEALINLANIARLGIRDRHREDRNRVSDLISEATAIFKRQATETADVELGYAIDLGANSLADLAMTNSDTIDFDLLAEAIGLHRKALEIILPIRGPVHHDTLSIRLNLCMSLALRALQYRGADYSIPRENLEEVLSSLELLAAESKEVPGASRIYRSATQELALMLLSARPNPDVNRAIELARQSKPDAEGAFESGTTRATNVMMGTRLAAIGEWHLAAEYFSAGVSENYRLNQLAGTLESRMRQSDEGAGLSITAAFSLLKAGHVEAAASVLESSKGSWISSVIRARLYKEPTLRSSAPELWAALQRVTADLSHLLDAELSTGRPFLLPEQYEPPTKEELTLQFQIDERQTELGQLLKEIRKIKGLGNFAKGADPLELLDQFTDERPIVLVGVCEWGSLAVILQRDNPPIGIIDDFYRHADLTNFVLGSQQGTGYGRGQLGNEKALSAALNNIGTVAPGLFDQISSTLSSLGYPAATLIPAGGIGLLPLHILGSTPLSDQCAVTYSPSLSILAALSTSEKALDISPRYLAIVGDKTRLEYVGLEVRLTTQWFPPDATEVPERAGREEVLRRMESFDIVHFVGHGQYDPNKPHRAAIHLADGSSIDFADLIRQEIQGGPRLLVMSACQTAVQARLPEELISLTTGFLVAGVRSVIGTLWPVDDLASALLMAKFFELATGGEASDIADCLTAAQQWLRKSTRSDLLQYVTRSQPATDVPYYLQIGDLEERIFSRPQFWAPFVLHGRPGKISGSKGRPVGLG